MTTVKEVSETSEDPTSGSEVVFNEKISGPKGDLYPPHLNKIQAMWEFLQKTRKIRPDIMNVDEIETPDGQWRRVITVSYESRGELKEIWKINGVIRDGVQDWLKDATLLRKKPSSLIFFNHYIRTRLGDTISSLAPRRRRPHAPHPAQ